MLLHFNSSLLNLRCNLAIAVSPPQLGTTRMNHEERLWREYAWRRQGFSPRIIHLALMCCPFRQRVCTYTRLGAELVTAYPHCTYYMAIYTYAVNLRPLLCSQELCTPYGFTTPLPRHIFMHNSSRPSRRTRTSSTRPLSLSCSMFSRQGCPCFCILNSHRPCDLLEYSRSDVSSRLGYECFRTSMIKTCQ